MNFFAKSKMSSPADWLGPGINVLPHADSDLPDTSLVDLNALKPADNN
jgi:hypothetical protein